MYVSFLFISSPNNSFNDDVDVDEYNNQENGKEKTPKGKLKSNKQRKGIFELVNSPSYLIYYII